MITAFSTFLPSLTSAISFICRTGVRQRVLSGTGEQGRVIVGLESEQRRLCRRWRAVYLEEDHGGDLLGREGLGLAQVLNLNHGVGALLDDLEGPGLDVLLDGGVIESAADKTPGMAVRDCSIVRSSEILLT